MNNDQIVDRVLIGDLNTASWAIPRLVKIYVSSSREEFYEERKILLENIGPELQSTYDSTGLEIEIVDMNYGTEFNPMSDPLLFSNSLNDISQCQNVSRGCFFLSLVGNQYQCCPLPVKLSQEELDQIKSKAQRSPDKGHYEFICENYEKCSESPEEYILKNKCELEYSEWLKKCADIVTSLQPYLEEDKIHRQFTMGMVELHTQHAREIDSDHMLVYSREFTGDDPPKTDEKLVKFKTSLPSLIYAEHLVELSVPWKAGGIDSTDDDHDTYISDFQDAMISKIKQMINQSIENRPELNARNKTIQEIVKETLIHLSYCKSIVNDADYKLENGCDQITEQIKSLMINCPPRHGPILIQGGHGSGKTTILTSVYQQCESWLNKEGIKILRFSGTTPRSSYNLELLRIICEQLNCLLSPNNICIPADASFDPLYVNNWFQTLIKKFESDDDPAKDKLLVVLIDDLHRLNPLDSDIVAALSWLPINLPKNVHFVATTLYSPDILKITPVQRERFKSPQCYIQLQPVSESFEFYIEDTLQELEQKFGKLAMTRIISFITIAEFGLSETELLELLMPTSNTDSRESLRLEDGNFNFQTFYTVRRAMKPLLMEKFMSGKILNIWRHKLASKIARKIYLPSEEKTLALHAEIGNLLFNEITKSDDDDEESSEKQEETDKFESDCSKTPFHSELHTSDVTYTLRHVEEAWIHLLKAGDYKLLKEVTLCNFDFLLAAVRTISVSYLRSILEHARCYILDRDVELIYYTIRKASDVLTRDTLQLGTQIICWLRKIQDSSPLMSRMVLAAMAWCDGYIDPLLVPLNSWLQPPMPMQIKNLNVGSQINLIETTPSGQHVIVVPHEGDPQMWRIMSNSLVHTFKGHTGKILCIHVSQCQSDYFLMSGSDDTSIIIWDMNTYEIKMKIKEHIAPVLCIVPALNNTLLISGGEDSRIIITSIQSKEVLVKIDHHRGPVTSIRITFPGDVLVSGSTDGSVCLWSLDDYSLLNTVSLPSPISMLSVSSDSVFLLIACDNNQMYLYTLATGTEIHCLKGHKSKIKSICLANDNQRAVAVGLDARIYVYDLHSGHLCRIISTPHNTPLTNVMVTDKDDFLITSGGTRLTFWSFRKEDNEFAEEPEPSRKASSKRPHSSVITCLDVSRDGTVAVTGGMDCLVNVWQMNSHELQSTMEGHLNTVSCVAISPNSIFAVSGSEDNTAKVWGLTLGSVVSTFNSHQSTILAVAVLSDSRRVVTSDKAGVIAVWVADNAQLLYSALGPSKCLTVTHNMKYIVSGDDDNSLRIWPTSPQTHKDDERFSVNHSEEITCFTVTWDSQYLITGSKDMSLKVWQVVGGKLAQVLVGHTDHVSCVAVAVTNKTLVVSGSKDSNLIVWDMETGNEEHFLAGHLGCVTCVKLAGDGTIAMSGSEDKRIIVWDIVKGVALSSLQLHNTILALSLTTDLSRAAVHLFESRYLPVVCLHNTPATYVSIPVHVPAKEIDDLPPSRPAGPKRPLRRLLKKEVSLDTYTWQRKYGHLTSSIMMAAVDERLKRRFSVSASMEEISKIPIKDNVGSQGLGPEQAALAQSQHFDQLEALWNKKSPPRSRRFEHSMSKQNSYSSRQHSVDTDEMSSPVDEFAE
uniref:Uncharacterized WD repeat-containing protein alr3466 n=1 Tax=Cacopsylla melanoneura TaxID=428564 RepID=A0A8D9ERW0_9HEMI